MFLYGIIWVCPLCVCIFSAWGLRPAMWRVCFWLVWSVSWKSRWLFAVFLFRTEPRLRRTGRTDQSTSEYIFCIIIVVYASWHTQLRLQRVLPHAVPSHRCTWLTPPLFHSCHWSVSQTCRVLYLECTVRAVKCCSTPVSSTPAGWQARSTGGSPLSLKETRYYYSNWCLILSRCFHCTFSPIG